jgi:DNA-binding response OmpR family regulator
VRALLVEDDATIAEFVARGLREAGFAVDQAADGDAGLTAATGQTYDVAIVDVMLPKRDGLSLIEELRRRGTVTPVLILSARRTVDDRVRGLQAGADDYLVKPFALEELLARVQALCRRSYGIKNPRLTIGDLEIDTATREVRRAGQPITLKPREYALLEYLALRRGEVVSRRDIETHIYDEAVDPMSNVIDSAISVLRKRLAQSGAPSLIHTRHGHGYVLKSEGG